MTIKKAYRRVAYTPKSRRPKGRIVIGVDPGLASTGIVVMREVRKNRYEVIFSKTIRSKPGVTLRERLEHIADNIVDTAKTYNARIVVCEAFEVRGWQKPMNSGQSMSKLINAISMKSVDAKLLFCLSTPDMKKRETWDHLLTEVNVEFSGRVKSSHAKDAGLHAILFLRGDTLEKLGVN
jgi:hypothetical protein